MAPATPDFCALEVSRRLVTETEVPATPHACVNSTTSEGCSKVLSEVPMAAERNFVPEDRATSLGNQVGCSRAEVDTGAKTEQHSPIPYDLLGQRPATEWSTVVQEHRLHEFDRNRMQRSLIQCKQGLQALNKHLRKHDGERKHQLFQKSEKQEQAKWLRLIPGRVEKHSVRKVPVSKSSGFGCVDEETRTRCGNLSDSVTRGYEWTRRKKVKMKTKAYNRRLQTWRQPGWKGNYCV